MFIHDRFRNVLSSEYCIKPSVNRSDYTYFYQDNDCQTKQMQNTELKVRDWEEIREKTFTGSERKRREKAEMRS